MSSSAPRNRRWTQPLLLSLYNGLLVAGGPILSLYLKRRLKAGREDRARSGERRGHASAARPPGLLIWFHAASVGESMSALRLIDRLLAERPDVGILFTSGTVTSARMIGARLGGRVIHQYAPVDRRAWVDRFLDHWRPDCAIFVESEIWPNLLWGVRSRGIAAALINARMSARSYARWRRAPATIARLLRGFALCLAQSPEEGLRLQQLGARNVCYVGQLKYAAEPLPADPATLARLAAAIGARPIWILASSHEGEEEIALAAHAAAAAMFPDLLTVIAPRHVGRGRSIARLATGAGLAAALRSDRPSPGAGDAVYIVDAMGELGLWYRLAGIACIGGSLVPVGGHNPIEAAQLDCAILHGPHIANIRGVIDDLQAQKAAWRVTDSASLADALQQLLGDPALAREMAASARTVAERNAKVIDRTFAALDPLIDRAAQRRRA